MEMHNIPITAEQLEELMSVAVQMQRDSEKVGEREVSIFAYAVQVAVSEIRKVREELTAAHSTIEKAREVTNCPDGVDLQDHLKQLVTQSRLEGINFAASRLAAAYNHGFIDKPLPEVFDVVRMILSAKEDLATPGEDGLSGEYAEQALKDWEAELSEGKA